MNPLIWASGPRQPAPRANRESAQATADLLEHEARLAPARPRRRTTARVGVGNDQERNQSLTAEDEKEPYFMSGRTSTRTPRQSRCERARSAEGGTGTVGGTAAPVFKRGPSQSHAPVPVPPSHNQGTTMADEWPLRDSIEFGALPGAVPCARLHARLVLAEWGLTGLSEQVELVVSELVTNAVAASRSLEWVFSVRLWLLSDRTRVLIAVWDANPRLPVRADANELAESGRGLQIVDTITTQWDAYATPQAGGKIVRAMCDGTAAIGLAANADDISAEIRPSPRA